jgi:hypothetical protein
LHGHIAGIAVYKNIYIIEPTKTVAGTGHWLRLPIGLLIAVGDKPVNDI